MLAGLAISGGAPDFVSLSLSLSKRTRQRLKACCCFVAVVSTACRDPVATAPPARLTAESSQPDDAAFAAVPPRYSAKISLAGTFRTGEMLAVTAVFSGNVDTKELRLSLWAPEVSLAAKHGWRLPGNPAADTVPALGEQTAGLAAGERRSSF
jgi:hypothetical protein